MQAEMDVSGMYDSRRFPIVLFLVTARIGPINLEMNLVAYTNDVVNETSFLVLQWGEI